MRWFSSLTILFYLSLLCTPQVFALHDAKVSPLADSQLQAVQPALQLHLLNQENEQEEPHSAALIAASNRFALSFEQALTVFALQITYRNLYKLQQSRAPPNVLSF